MVLDPGTRLGPYEVTASLGVGGMGEVYRATDTNLGRQVAVKVLPEAFADDPDRLARFEREAKTLAALNHPNIAQIYGQEKADGIRALVMELVEGPTLAERIAQGAIPVEEALRVAKQIAEALEAAHEQDIIHRDLKPANIKLRPDGTVKVLDFGLAKTLDPVGAKALDATASPTITSPAMMTGVGMLLGTAAYMSPEQTRGKPVDKRSDIWAFGCVLYEMLTGKAAFRDQDVSLTLSKILRIEPEWSALPLDTPATIGRLLHRCLAKERKGRLDSAAAARLDVEDALATPLLCSAPTTGVAWRVVAGVMATLSVAALVVAAIVWINRRPADGRVARLDITPAASMPFSPSPPGVDVAISDDGMKIVYTTRGSASNGLVLRQLSQTGAQPLADTANGYSPAFSPDGTRIAFFSENTLRVLTLGTSTSLVVCEVGDGAGISWDGNDQLVFAIEGGKDGGLFRVAAAGGTPTRLTSPETGQDHVHPIVLPTRDGVVFTIRATAGSQIALRGFDSDEIKILVQSGSSPRYASSGHLLFVNGEALQAIRFDQSGRETVGSRVTVESTIDVDGDANANYGIAQNGSLVYIPAGSAGDLRKIVWKDRQGNRLGDAVSQWLDDPRYPRISPDGRRLALTSGQGQRGDVWVYSLTGDAQPLRLTSEAHNIFPVWMPDGQRIAFVSRTGSRNTVVVLAADASSVEPRPLIARDHGLTPSTWSPDGQTLLLSVDVGPPTRGDLWTLRIGESNPQRWLDTRFEEGEARFSPDAKWVTYVSDQTGRPEVWVRSFPGPGPPVRVSVDGGADPLWAKDGSELFYQVDNRLMAVSVTVAPELRLGPPRVLFEGGFVGYEPSIRRTFDVSGDGRVLMIERNLEAATTGFVLVQNWLEELKRLVPTP